MFEKAVEYLRYYLEERGFSGDLSRFYFGDHEGKTAEVQALFGLSHQDAQEAFDTALEAVEAGFRRAFYQY